MDPNAQQPQNNDAILAAIAALKTDMAAEIDTRLEAQQAAFEERLKPVDTIANTLEEARKANLEAQRRANPAPAWQPKSWDEIPQLIQTEAQRIAQETLDARDRKVQQQTERQTNEERELETQIDQQLVSLERGGYLPAINNPNDYNDPGVASRRELLAAASHMGTPELDKVADTLSELHKQNMVFDAQTKTYKSAAGSLTPLPGKYAPVGNGSSRAPSQAGIPSYKEIHEARDMDSLMALAEQRGYGPLPTVSNVDTGF